MESYTPFLEKIRLPQPSFQRLAVTSIFSKLRSAPNHLDCNSEPGREAISRCLHSNSSAVVDQSVRELCRLVVESKMDLSRGLLELQSALEGSEPKMVGLFVKGIGLLIRTGFRKTGGSWWFGSTESHPFVKVLLCRAEARDELVQQVLLFMVHNKQMGMMEVCGFLRPFLNFSILRIPFSDSSSTFFVIHLLTSMASLCCSLHDGAIAVFKLLIQCIQHFPHKSADESGGLIHFVGDMVDAYILVLRHLVSCQTLISEIQLCGVELLETILQLGIHPIRQSRWREPIIKFSKRLLLSQIDLGLKYMPELSSISLSLFSILMQSDLEHEQVSILKVIPHLLKWKTDAEYFVNGCEMASCEELLFLFPAISLMSSPSKCIKEAASELIAMLQKIIEQPLTALKDCIASTKQLQSVSFPGRIMLKFLQQLWSQDLTSSSLFFIETFASKGITHSEGIPDDSGPLSKLIEHTLWIADRKKSSLAISRAQEVFGTEMPMLVCTVATVLVMHQLQGPAAVDVLTVSGLMDPKLGVPLLLAVLFFSNIFARKDVGCGDMLLKVLGMLPSLASNSPMVPLVVQTILPLLHKNANIVLYATATRLVLQTWVNNDRAFGSLQGILHPKKFAEFMHEKNVLLSMATSIRDVCRENPDRGVDLILSVSTCIETQDPLIQAIGFQSLAHLCEADVVDFYTAWDVIKKHMLDYSKDPILAHSICLLLRWGAMDAEAYPEVSHHVVQTLFDIGASTHLSDQFKWSKARASAFDALTNYEIPHIEKIVPEFKERSTSLLFSETNDDVLGSMERLHVKIIAYEHANRRRFVREIKAATNKIEKLLDALPQAIFSSGKTNARELPGAALLCLSFTPKDLKRQVAYIDVHSQYENMMVEIAASLQLSRNTFLALLALQSWRSFMRRWLRANIMCLDAKMSSVSSDKPSKAAHDILKSIMRIAEDSIPRSAENIALALSALCMVLPRSAHTVISAASKFLLNWLFQFEHEHRQWSAAISLGVISSCLHITDHKQKFKNVSGLIEVLLSSKSTFIKGACGVGLGFSCQDLLTGSQTADDAKFDRDSYEMGEIKVIGNIIRSLSLTILQVTKSSSGILKSLCESFPNDLHENGENFNHGSFNEEYTLVEEDIWGLTGLVLGLGSSISAVYRTGEVGAVLKIKELIISWTPHANRLVWSCDTDNEGSERFLSVGSCLALPLVMAFCQGVELVDIGELDSLLNGYRELISELLSVKKSGTFHQSLLMTSCAGAGSLLACNEGTHLIEVGCVKELLDLFRKCYSNPQPPSVCLGGMLGVVNSLGAWAGILVPIHSSSSDDSSYRQRESSNIIHLLVSNPISEPLLTTVVQEMFLVAQSPSDRQLQRYSAWALSFLRNSLWSTKVSSDGDIQTDRRVSQVGSQAFPGDSIVVKLCSWLMNVSYSKMSGAPTEMHTADARTITVVIKCLSQAPRLPNLEWKVIVRHCMRYALEVGDSLPSDLTPQKGILREECIRFSLAHASQVDQLLEFLDELSDLPRFRTLEPNLQSCLLFHLADLAKVFSSSRLEKLLSDIAHYLFSLSSNQVCDLDLRSLLCVSCWKGLRLCLDEDLLDSEEYHFSLERCMAELFSLLPSSHSATIAESDHINTAEEWCEAVQCFEKAPRDWLLDFLQVELDKGNGWLSEVLKKIELKVRLVRTGSIPLAELGRLKTFIFNCYSNDIWNVLIEVVVALQHAEGSVKREWLVDAVEISCVSNYPSTALQFIGVLSGSCCKYMPFLILDRFSVLSDLPITLNSLLTDPTWEVIAERFTARLLASIQRIYNWVTQPSHAEGILNLEHIDKSENELMLPLLHVMYDACMSLRNYLPLEKHIELVNMVIP